MTNPTKRATEFEWAQAQLLEQQRQRIEQLEAEIHDLRNQLQVQLLATGEARLVLLNLLQRIQQVTVAHDYGGGLLYPSDFELQFQDARELLARVGLL